MPDTLQMVRPTLLRDRARLSPNKFAHIVLRTPRFNQMVEWYLTVLDADPVFINPMMAFITYDDEHHRLAFVNQPQLGDGDPMSAGVDHMAFTYASMERFLENYERLKALGIEPGWCVNHGGTTSMYYADPDRNQVELQIDNFDTVEDLTTWLQSGEIEKNPIGVEFDPDILVRKFREGMPISELVKQGSAGA